MAKRVLLGKKGSDYGLFISKPGVDVILELQLQLLEQQVKDLFDQES